MTAYRHAAVLPGKGSGSRRCRGGRAARAMAQVSTEAWLLPRLEIGFVGEIYGWRSERKARLLEQMEFQLEELEAASEDELAADMQRRGPWRSDRSPAKRSSRKPFRLICRVSASSFPARAPCALRLDQLAKLGETITETLESVPRQWKVIQTVPGEIHHRDCEKITQPPAPFHTIPRGWARPSLLAMILFEFGRHQPLNRQCERFARGRGQPVDPGRSGRDLRRCLEATR